MLPNQDLLYFTKAASNLGMQCLIEVWKVQRLMELGVAVLDAGDAGAATARVSSAM